MSDAYIIGHITVKDTEKWAEYCESVPKTIVPWQGSLVFRGRRSAVLSGDHDFAETVVIRFPDLTSIEGWHTSAAYQSLVPLRQQAADVVIISYET